MLLELALILASVEMIVLMMAVNLRVVMLMNMIAALTMVDAYQVIG